jgi:hypothetical protein
MAPRARDDRREELDLKYTVASVLVADMTGATAMTPVPLGKRGENRLAGTITPPVCIDGKDRMAKAGLADDGGAGRTRLPADGIARGCAAAINSAAVRALGVAGASGARTGGGGADGSVEATGVGACELILGGGARSGAALIPESCRRSC